MILINSLGSSYFSLFAFSCLTCVLVPSFYDDFYEVAFIFITCSWVGSKSSFCLEFFFFSRIVVVGKEYVWIYEELVRRHWKYVMHIFSFPKAFRDLLSRGEFMLFGFYCMTSYCHSSSSFTDDFRMKSTENW